MFPTKADETSSEPDVSPAAEAATEHSPPDAPVNSEEGEHEKGTLVCDEAATQIISDSDANQTSKPNPESVANATTTEIIRRRTDAAFPEVLPSENTATEIDTKDAEDLLSWSMQMEHVKIQSYIDAQYQAFRESNVVCTEPEPIIRAQWARQSYYVHLAAFRAMDKVSNAGTESRLCTDPSAVRTSESLTPAPTSGVQCFTSVLPIAHLPEDVQAQVRALLPNKGVVDISSLASHIDTEWRLVWTALPAFAQPHERNLRNAWIKEHVLGILLRYKEKQTAFSFQPEFPLAQIPAGPLHVQATELTAQVLPEHVNIIATEVNAAFEGHLATMPPFLVANMEPDRRSQLRHHFLHENYFTILKRVLDRPPHGHVPFTFVPAIAVESLPDAEQARAREIVAARGAPGDQREGSAAGELTSEVLQGTHGTRTCPAR